MFALRCAACRAAWRTRTCTGARGFELALVDVDGTKKSARPASANGLCTAHLTRRQAGRVRNARPQRPRRAAALDRGPLEHRRAAAAPADRRRSTGRRCGRPTANASCSSCPAIVPTRVLAARRRHRDAEHLIDTRAAEGWNAGGAQMRLPDADRESATTGSRCSTWRRGRSRRSSICPARRNTAAHVARREVDGVCVERDRPLRGVDRAVPAQRRALSGDPRRRVASDVAPDGQSLYFDRDHQMFRLAVNTKDIASIGEPTPLPIKGSRRPSIAASST